MTLAEKLLKVMKTCAVIGKDSTNDEVGYSYISAAKLNAAVNKALTENGIVTTANTKIEHFEEVAISSHTENLVAVVVTITLINVDDANDTMTISGAGSGIDAGDKAIAKAQTMAVKYAWKDTLLIADKADDPDANTNTLAYKRKF